MYFTVETNRKMGKNYFFVNKRPNVGGKYSLNDLMYT